MYKDVDSFRLQYNIRIAWLIETAETEGENVELAEAARVVQNLEYSRWAVRPRSGLQIEAQQLMRELRPGLDEAWMAARRVQ